MAFLAIVLFAPLAGCLAEFPAAPAFDGGGPTDTSTRDRQAMDGLATDARPADRGPTDVGPADRGLTDRGPADRGTPDAARVDAAADMATLDAASDDMAVDAVVIPDGCMPVDEICNGLDDDCNGRIDDLAVLQAPCRVPGRDCTGALRCDVELQAVVCEPIPGAVEICDGEDQDCDRAVDEQAEDAQGPCTVGLGACQRVGRSFCAMGEVRCDGVPGMPGAETCNEIDDDCNGVVDDAPGVGDACGAGTGACAVQGVLVCQPGNLAPVCGATPGNPGVETCNQVDDDCNGILDDVAGAGDECEAGVGVCRQVGEMTCQNGQLRCSAQAGQGGVEVCNALDDDCDTRTDEGPVCVQHALTFCRAWLAWASPAAPEEPVGQWGADPYCPPSESIQVGADRCTASAADGSVRPLSLGMAPGNPLDADDALAIAFSCSGGEPGVSDWIAEHCSLVLAHAPPDTGGLGGLVPAECPVAVGPLRELDRLGPRCVRTATKGEFHPLWLHAPVGNGSELGVALLCDAPAEEERARGIDTGVAVRLAYTTFRECPSGMGVVVGAWPACFGGGAPPLDRCVDSGGDRAIHGFSMGSEQFDDLFVDCHGVFGIGLVPAQ